MVEFDRVKARCRADVDQSLLRGIQSDRMRLSGKLALVEGEIEGARKAIEVKERQIEAARRQAAELRQRLASLDSQADVLADHKAV